MEIIKAIVNTYGAEILGAILTALAGVVGLAVKNLAAKYIDTSVKRSVARTVVQGVEQLYKDLDGEEKLAKALEAAAAMLQENGITVTDLELRMLIEAAVGEFNQVFAAKPLEEIATGLYCEKGAANWSNPGPDEPGAPGPAGMTGAVYEDGVDIDDLTDDQLRAVLQQIGFPAPDSFTRDDLLAALDEAAAQANT